MITEQSIRAAMPVVAVILGLEAAGEEQWRLTRSPEGLSVLGQFYSEGSLIPTDAFVGGILEIQTNRNSDSPQPSIIVGKSP